MCAIALSAGNVARAQTPARYVAGLEDVPLMAGLAPTAATTSRSTVRRAGS
ncbi:MAG: hypothetical protein WDO24_07505 [Pseudomonadota bacterium]